jgi:hypothetical protein
MEKRPLLLHTETDEDLGYALPLTLASDLTELNQKLIEDSKAREALVRDK